MTKIIELEDSNVLDKVIESAKVEILKHLNENLGEDEAQVYLFALGIEDLVKNGELPTSYLEKEYNSPDDIDEELQNHNPPISEIGFNALVNSFGITSYGNTLFGTFYYNSDRFYDGSYQELREDVESFMEFEAAGDNAETIDVVILTSDSDGNIKAILL